MRFSQPVPGGDAYHLCPHFQARTQTQSQITAKEAKRYSLAGCHRGRRKSNKHLSLSILKEFPNIPSQTNNRPKTKKKTHKNRTTRLPRVFPITSSDNSVLLLLRPNTVSTRILIFLSYPTSSPWKICWRHLQNIHGIGSLPTTSATSIPVKDSILSLLKLWPKF